MPSSDDDSEEAEYADDILFNSEYRGYQKYSLNTKKTQILKKKCSDHFQKSVEDLRPIQNKRRVKEFQKQK